MGKQTELILRGRKADRTNITMGKQTEWILRRREAYRLILSGRGAHRTNIKRMGNTQK
jgi:hypothetical protein